MKLFLERSPIVHQELSRVKPVLEHHSAALDVSDTLIELPDAFPYRYNISDLISKPPYPPSPVLDILHAPSQLTDVPLRVFNELNGIDCFTLTPIASFVHRLLLFSR